MSTHAEMSQDGNTAEECVDFALQNEAAAGKEGLWMSRSAAAVYADGYKISREAFEAEMYKRNWTPDGAI